MHFNRSMHYVMLSYVVRPSVRPCVRLSVCLSVTLKYSIRISWVSSKVISRIISLRLRSSEPHHRQSSPMGTSPKFEWIGVGSLFSAENLQHFWGKIGPRLLLMAMKMQTRLRLVTKSMILDDLERPLRTPLHKMCVFRILYSENLNEDRPTLLAARM